LGQISSEVLVAGLQNLFRGFGFVGGIVVKIVVVIFGGPTMKLQEFGKLLQILDVDILWILSQDCKTSIVYSELSPSRAL
jgi:hypothetical protein